MAWWQSFIEVLGLALAGLHGAIVPLAGPYAWGLAIVMLTVAVRVLLVPLGLVQARVMKRRYALAPLVEAAQQRFDTSASLRKRDPDRFLANFRKQQAAVREIYQEHGVRPVTNFMVMVIQSPVLFGLYRLLASHEAMPLLQAAPFLLIERLSLSVLAGAGVGALMLVAIVGLTTWTAQRQVLRVTPRQPNQPSPAALGLVMTGVITALGMTLPAGVLVYWATTGLWTVGQQALLLR